MAVPESLNVARAIVIPDDSRDPIIEVQLSMLDGGLTSLWGALEGEPVEIACAQRRDVVAFVNEAAVRDNYPRNLRASRLLSKSLHPGQYVAGVAVLCGQRSDLGVTDLPRAVTIDVITSMVEAQA